VPKLPPVIAVLQADSSQARKEIAEIPKAAEKAMDDTGKAMKEGGEKAGAAGGKAAGEAFTRDANGKLRDSRGKFVSEGGKAGAAGGKAAGTAFGLNFKRSMGGYMTGAALAGTVMAVGKIGMEYEDSINIFQGVTKANVAQLQRVQKTARDLGADVKLPGVSAAGAAKAMTELAKSGLNVKQSMDAARGTLMLARVAGMEEGEAANIAASAVNAFGLKAKDVYGVVDQLAASAASSSVEVQDVAASFKMAAAVYSGFQGPVVGAQGAITELNTAIAILGRNGIAGSDAGTSLKQMLLQLTGPSDKAKDAMKAVYAAAQGAAMGEKDLAKAMNGGKKERADALASIQTHNKGLKLQGDIAYDAQGKMRPLRDIIKLTAAGTKGMTDEQRNSALTTIFGADATRAMIALMKGGMPAYDAMEKALTKQGSAADQAAAKNKGLRGAIDNVRSQAENAAIGIYEKAKGPLTKGLNTLADQGPKMAKQLVPPLKTVGKFLGQVADVAEPVVIGALGAAWAVLKGGLEGAAAVLGPIAGWLEQNKTLAQSLAVAVTAGVVAWKLWTGAIAAWSAITKAAAAAQGIFNAVMAANPIMLIVIALVAVAAGLIYAYKHSEKFRNVVKAAGKVAGAAFGWVAEKVCQVWKWIKDHWGTIGKVLMGPMGIAVRWIVGHWDDISAAGKKVVGWVKSAWAKVKTYVVEPMKTGIQWIKDKWSAMIDWFKGLKDKFDDIGRGIVDGLKAGISARWDAVVGWVQTQIGRLPAAAKKVLGIASPSRVFRALGLMVAAGMAAGIRSGWKAVEAALDRGLSAVKKRYDKAKSAYSDTRSAYGQLYTTVRDAFRGPGLTERGGTVAEMRRSLQDQAAQSRAMLTTLRSLRKGGLNATMLRQLAEAGPEALGQARGLLAGGQIRAFNDLQRQISGTARSAGQFEAKSVYGQDLRAQRRAVLDLSKDIRELTRAIKVSKARAKKAGKNASGTSSWGGGLTWLNEAGPELVDLPRGARVYTARESAAMAARGEGTTLVADLHLHVDGVELYRSQQRAVLRHEQRNGKTGLSRRG